MKDNIQQTKPGRQKAEVKRTGSWPVNCKFLNEKGVALVMSLIISLGIMVLVVGVLYVSFQSTSMSGAGKRYSTAEEAADGAVEIIKDGIINTQRTEPLPSIIDDTIYNCFLNATLTEANTCTVYINLPGAGDVSKYIVTATFENLFKMAIPGSRIEYARSGGAAATAVYYRIVIEVEDTNITGTAKAENSILYRYTG